MGSARFFDLGERYRGLDAKKDPLVVLNAVVPWEDFRAQVSVVWRKPEEERKSAAGRKPWDEIVIFKTLVLQALYTRIPQIGGPSVCVRGPNSLNDDLRTASRGRWPGLTSFNARSYPRDSAGSADRVLFWAHVACQVPRQSRRLSPAGSTSSDPPWPQAVDHRQNTAEQITRDRHLSHLEHCIAGVSDHLRADLHHLLPKRGERPAFDLIRQNQRAEEVGQVVGQGMKLET